VDPCDRAEKEDCHPVVADGGVVAVAAVGVRGAEAVLTATVELRSLASENSEEWDLFEEEQVFIRKL
jgi:hypothetical protein